MTVAISLLGPVEATRDGRPVDLGAPQQRALLALLALNAGRLVGADTIVDTLWPDDPPASAAKIVQTYVSRLRKALGDDTIERRGAGYALRVPADAVDAARFERLVNTGDATSALALWRGPALADVPALDAEAQRLEELRLRALEERFDSDLAAGRHGELVGELRALVAANPLRERLLGQLMVALYRAGRQAEALEVYRAAHRRFADELGLEPGPTLKELERRILAQDVELLPPPPPAMRRRRRAAWVGAAAVAVAAIAGAVALAMRGENEAPVVVAPNSIVRIDSKTNRVVEVIRVGRTPGAIAASGRYVWVANDGDKTLSRVDTETKEVQTIGGVPYVGIVTTDERGNAYVSGFDDPLVWKIDATEVSVVQKYRVESRAVGVAVGGGSLWVVDRFAGAVKQIDLATGRVEGTIGVGTDPINAAFGYGALWVANSDDATVSVVRPGVTEVETIDVSSRPLGVAAGERSVWVVSFHEGTITRIEPDTRRVIDEIEAGGFGLLNVATAGGAVWATNPEALTVVRVDPRTNRQTATIRLPGSPRGIAAAGEDVWVALAEPGAE